MGFSLEYLSIGLKPASFAIGCIMLFGLSQLNSFLHFSLHWSQSANKEMVLQEAVKNDCSHFHLFLFQDAQKTGDIKGFG